MTQPKLFECVLGSPLIGPLQRGLAAGDFLRLHSVADAAKPFLCALLSRVSSRPLLIITADTKRQEALHTDLLGFHAGALFFPAWETLPDEDQLPAASTIADRLRVITALSPPPAALIVVASVQSVCQKTFSPATLTARRLVLTLGQRIDRDELLAALAERGYGEEFQVSDPGDLAMRGGIVDCFPLDRDEPVRIELAGDEIESIRTFDPVTQQSRAKLDTITIAPAGEVGLLKQDPAQAASLIQLLPANTLLVLDEPELLTGSTTGPLYESWDNVLATGRQQIHLTEAINFEIPDALNLRLTGLDAYRPLDTRAPDPTVAEQLRRGFFDQMQTWATEGYAVHITCSTTGEQQRFEELWREQFPAVPSSFILHSSSLSHGFLWPDAKFVVVTDAEIFGRHKLIRPRHKFHKISQPVDWAEFQEGDYVVHLQHGIGKYLGLKTIEVTVRQPVDAVPLTQALTPAKQQQEVLVLEYANQARLYVPVDQAHLVTKYISAGKRVPPLHELGGSLWEKQKSTAERAIMDLASELLEIQAARETLAGHPFPADTPWQTEFEAAFPYDETPDQETAIVDVKQDMEKPKPMDRLICGDVGYGKTEVAIRAAFKAVMGGMQVAVLVPTTILAEQHWNTFRERMAGYPINIEMLSRFRSPAESKKVVQLLAEGSVDILIGTHRLLSGDVEFKNLGLLVIDEEQRFGVLHKEKFKQLRKLIDVLTLSATPIPRTLYLSLTGARDMSTIQTPPQDRLPVETIVALYDERTIKQAIQRELARGGQVFFLHNRVQSIETVADRLRQLLADATPQHPTTPAPRVDVGHGQMSEHELETVMHRFVHGQIDVLVCTTIIESGLDIPNANTIIIDRADRFGLSDLYQLRGRVGRYKHQAYAYILLPRHLAIVQSARKRISAIKQYSSLGSGFKIAMRDLEIRGAGNILGAEQSGHITAIGFDLYCQLLKDSIAGLKGEKKTRPPLVTLKFDFLKDLARIPENFITDHRLRIQAYRKIAACTELAEVKTLRAEFRDRYGKISRGTELLLQCADVKILAGRAKADTVETRDDKIILTQRGILFQLGGKFPRLTKEKPESKLTEIKKLLESLAAENRPN